MYIFPTTRIEIHTQSLKQIEFVINDSIVYTNINQFKSKEAVKLWTDLHNFTIETGARAKELAELRAKYAKTVDESERLALGSKIIDLEKKNLEMKNQIVLKTNQVRKTEIDFLQKNK